MTRVIHTGDTHIGYQQYHRPERRADFLGAFEQVADDAIEDEVDAVVHAGDLFHDRQPDLQDILGVLEVLRSLAAAEIPFLAVVGNHETKRHAQWLDLFESLGVAVRLGKTPHVIGETAFYGLDFVPRSQREELAYEFERHDTEHAVLVAHGLFEPFDYGDWDTKRMLTESSVPFDAVLLGDNHTPDRTEVDDTILTYCGSTERTSTAEVNERGYNILDILSDRGMEFSRRGLDTREFVFVDVELAPDEGIARVTERLSQHELTDSVVVVTIDGAGDPVAPASIESFIHEQGALVARVSDRREHGEEETIEASFADPDEAVRERVSELGLSEEARTIDDTVRSHTVANANVADTVERRIRDQLDDIEASYDDDEETDAEPTIKPPEQSTVGEYQ